MGVNDVMQYHIYWTPQTELLELQGANIRFDRMNQVFYENQWLPSGEWLQGGLQNVITL